MTRSLLGFLVALTVGGCAAMSSTVSGSSSSASASAYEPMSSPPPEPRKEDVPRVSDNEVWVPGYYQPVAGTWVWHQGEVREAKAGYTLIVASYREQNGKFLFSPPRWRRADLAAAAQK